MAHSDSQIQLTATIRRLPLLLWNWIAPSIFKKPKRFLAALGFLYLTAVYLTFFGLGPVLSLPHSPKAINVVAGMTGPGHNATLTIEFDQTMDQSSLPSDASIYEFTVDGVPFPILGWVWSDATHLNIIVTHASVDGEVFCVRLKRPDPLLIDVHGHACLGWSQLCDALVVAFAPKFGEDGKQINP